jgi:hypothetical protein
VIVGCACVRSYMAELLLRSTSWRAGGAHQTTRTLPQRSVCSDPPVRLEGPAVQAQQVQVSLVQQGLGRDVGLRRRQGQQRAAVVWQPDHLAAGAQRCSGRRRQGLYFFRAHSAWPEASVGVAGGAGVPIALRASEFVLESTGGARLTSHEDIPARMYLFQGSWRSSIRTCAAAAAANRQTKRSRAARHPACREGIPLDGCGIEKCCAGDPAPRTSRRPQPSGAAARKGADLVVGPGSGAPGT